MIRERTTSHASYDVQLPVGLVDAEGRLHRTATLRKMRGREEDLLYDTRLDAGRLISALLTACIERVGDLVDIQPDLVDQMTSSDRDYLLVELRRLSLGDRLNGHQRCPACQHHFKTQDDLSRLPLRRLSADELPYAASLTLEDGYVDADGETHREVTLRLPTGADETFVAATAERDPLRARDALLLRCITRFGALRRAQLEGYGGKILRELTLGDRRQLWHAFIDERPGVDFRRIFECPVCGKRFRSVMDAADFFGLG